jgi:hypothetical protein
LCDVFAHIDAMDRRYSRDRVQASFSPFLCVPGYTAATLDDRAVKLTLSGAQMDLCLFGTETIEEASRRQLDSELAAAIEDQPCGRKAIRLCPGAACKPSLSSERLGKVRASIQPLKQL